MEDKQIFEKWEEFKSLLKSTNREGIENIITWLDESDFKFAPASTQYHSSMRGGLLYHSLQVYYHMYDFSNLIQFFGLTPDTIIITALLHDVCKVDTYTVSYRNVKQEDGNWVKMPYFTVDEHIPYGHGEKSVWLLNKKGLKTTVIEDMMIRSHMGAFRDNQYLNDVSHRFSKCPQSLILHFADMLSTYTTESSDLQQRYKDQLLGRNINECLQELNKPKTIKYNGVEYQIAPDNIEADGTKIIPLILEDGTSINVYAPYGDGLPF